jgi:hypothetical protein
MFYALNHLSTLFATPLGVFGFAFVILFFDYFYLYPKYWLDRVLHGPATNVKREPLPSGLVIIPSLMRAKDELDAIKATIESVTTNDYPGSLVIIASIDGYTEAPHLYRDLEQWVAKKQVGLAEGVWLYLTGRAHRGGKPMAIEEGVQHMHALVARGEHSEFPKIYFSTDADADLGPRALELIGRRLCMKNPITKSPGRAVAGNLYVRGNDYWRGLRHFFTQEGQVSIQVARDYLVTNVTRYNKRPMPIAGTTGVLYCIWTDIFLQGPRFMGFMRTLTITDWLKWWFGHAPPRFSTSTAKPIPELMVGDTDDTVSAFLAIAARWEDGRFTLDAPRTPLHALYYMLRSVFIDRALRHEPEARVYTSSPTTVLTLWRQRRRWNTARIEVTGRFTRSLRYHWDLGICTLGTLAMTARYIAVALYCYVQLPLAVMQGSAALRMAIGLGIQYAVYSVWTILALSMNGELRKNWRLLLAIPLAPAYTLVFAFFTTLSGIISDVFLFGNITKFAPETTLIQGRSTRIALLSRVRRAAVLLVRSVVYGDVPVGLFWLGWNETRWTPSGFLGWTTGKKPTLRDRLRHGAEETPVPAPEVAMVRASEAPSPANVTGLAVTGMPRVDLLRESVAIPHVQPANLISSGRFTVAMPMAFDSHAVNPTETAEPAAIASPSAQAGGRMKKDAA